jgi:hypothetical protein
LASGTGQHDAGAIIVGKDQGLFDGAGGEDDARGANDVETFAGRRRGRQIVRIADAEH